MHGIKFGGGNHFNLFSLFGGGKHDQKAAGAQQPQAPQGGQQAKAATPTTDPSLAGVKPTDVPGKQQENMVKMQEVQFKEARGEISHEEATKQIADLQAKQVALQQIAAGGAAAPAAPAQAPAAPPPAAPTGHSTADTFDPKPVVDAGVRAIKLGAATAADVGKNIREVLNDGGGGSKPSISGGSV